VVRAAVHRARHQPLAAYRAASIDLWQAAAPPASQLFLLVGAVILIPVVLAYTGFGYWVFRGKVRPGEHYH
jgi:cytochrome d ubiquinol oxidase subunit II